MKNTLIIMVFALVSLFLFPPAVLQAEQGKIIELPAPQTDIGKPLMQVLKERQTSRQFAEKPLPQQTLSNLLWAAFGINRLDTGKRTAPSARNRQEIDIYLAMDEGVFRYDAHKHALVPVLAKDIRALTGGQTFVADAPVNFVYVADYSKMDGDMAEKKFYAAADTGFIAQNVYLFCASEGLATVVRGYVDRPALAEAMKLAPDQAITLAQTVGFPDE